MTYSIILSTATILLLVCFSPLTTTTTTTAADTTVLDIDGHPLQADTNYYILPVIRGQGGGLTLVRKNGTELCPPAYVGQDNLQVSNGLPLKFYPVNPQDQNIQLNTDLNVVFDVATICVESTVWRLTEGETSEGSYVGIGGTIGNPGIQTISNWFKIEKAGNGEYDYKFVFCPGVCEFCLPLCGDIGVFIQEDGRRLLGLRRRDEQPLLVNFIKA